MGENLRTTMHVVSTWVENGERHAMRSDGVVFSWCRMDDRWQAAHSEPHKAVPGCANDPCALGATPA